MAQSNHKHLFIKIEEDDTRHIFWLILFLSIIAAIGIFIPFRVYGADFAIHEITKLSSPAKQQLPKRQAKPPKVGTNRKKYKSPQLPSYQAPQLPQRNPNFTPFFQQLHPIRHA